ncbi:Plant disease resistance response protein [Corchorus olitorius]|uniref:Dirigent protein n=1 Tax=Corchorus olitorius TaxID=93759 RepID=A0A1R3H7N3_9ROSI|nr:Plant disease resistance response protein [Corchorus olitorius]
MGIIFSIVAAKADDDELEETYKMSVYVHDYSSGGPNSTDIAVVGIPGKIWSFTQFGTLFVCDDAITEGPEPNSEPVGRVQGISVTTSLEGIRALVAFSIVFTNKAYNGSTIEVQGNSNQFDSVREYGVASGTGKFLYAQGYVTYETYFFDPWTSYAVSRCNISIRMPPRHHWCTLIS